jgi:hypothetical protein
MAHEKVILPPEKIIIPHETKNNFKVEVRVWVRVLIKVWLRVYRV